jgi:hypothetical protein
VTRPGGCMAPVGGGRTLRLAIGGHDPNPIHAKKLIRRESEIAVALSPPFLPRGAAFLADAQTTEFSLPHPRLASASRTHNSWRPSTYCAVLHWPHTHAWKFLWVL